MLKEISYLMLPVADLDVAVAFYRDSLGMELLWNEVRQGHAAFNTSAGPLVLRVASADSRDGAGSEGAIIAFEVPDIDTAYRELEQRGVQFLGQVEEHAGRKTARFRDPFGNTLELNQIKQIAHHPQH